MREYFRFEDFSSEVGVPFLLQQVSFWKGAEKNQLQTMADAIIFKNSALLFILITF